ncbi:FecR family protein [Aestuariivivens insulae]|uniref:FecR family protein n=1 Tax=Aestuariivivens insulae TaxID=1621988 RepID=UPI001F56F5C7|nr:FecR family protein [Aestuariivivens insulae]
MTPKIEKIIVKYLTNSATVSDLDLLSKWIEEESNKVLFKEFVKTHFAIHCNMNDPETDLAIGRLLQAIRKERAFVYKIKKQPIYKYVAAASVLLVVGLTLFLNRAGESYELHEPSIVNETIVPGTDKATLTLEDGSQIALEKGAFIQTSRANSNGEQIVYKKESGKTKELKYNYLTIPRGGQFNLVLSDGTEVWLNSESQLKYPVSFIDGETRQVELVYGEAYFDVSPSSEHNGDKFKVHNSSQDIEVFGTEFNVKAYKDEFNVYTTLVEGKVVVEVGGARQDLVPSEQSNLNVRTMGIEVSMVDVEEVISWKNGVFSFKGKPLKDIMKVISRWYDIDVVFENKELETITFKGVLGKDQDIEEILMTIKTLSVLKEYEIIGNTVVLK